MIKIFKEVVLVSLFFVLSGTIFAPFAKEKFKVVTTFTIFADMAKNVAGDKAEIVSITKPGADIHTYQPTPRDILKAENADLILWNGLNLELWFKKFFQNIKSTPSVILTKGIEPMGIREGSYKGKPNPHAWMSPKDGLIYIENIRAAFVKYDPENASTYNRNAKEYSKELTVLGLESSDNITLDSLKHAFNSKAFLYHPDHNKGNENDAAKKFDESRKAYNKLKKNINMPTF